jgi:hypothetical protein
VERFAAALATLGAESQPQPTGGHRAVPGPQLLRGSVVMLVFFMSFGGMLLSINLWEQNEWGWSALKTGLAILPGPLMFPVSATFVAGRLIRRFSFAAVATAGSVIMCAGLVWWAAGATVTPAHAAGMLGGLILVGIAIFVAIVGTPQLAGVRQAAFHHGWIALAPLGCAAAAAATLLRQPARNDG